MSFVEKELTVKNIERAHNHPEFEKYKETEHKLTSTNPALLKELLMEAALPIEQLYLSTPHDEFSLRIKCAYTPEGIRYTATQKDRGELSGEALQRSEVESEITAEAYEYYKNMNLPTVRKRRTEVMEGVTVDFYDDANEPVIVEVEHVDPMVRAQLIETMQSICGDTLVDRSGDSALTNEAIACRTFQEAGQAERLTHTPESLDHFSKRVFKDMIAHYVTGKKRVIVGLTGMSGAGKTTVTNAIKQRIVEQFGEAFSPLVISTDDYHFGKQRLEAEYGAPYMEWDAAKTYDTAQLAEDLTLLAEGQPIAGRRFDFDTEEPHFEGEVSDAPFVIIEGLYAGSEQLNQVRDLHYQLPTSIATAVGRDVRRLVIDNRANRAFPTPESRLKYQIEVALPTYLEQDMPPKRSFNASMRPLAERAFMLAQL